MKLVEITEKEYEKFLNKFDNTLFFQSVEWAKFKSKTEWNMTILGLKDKNNIKAACILLSRKVPFINKKMYYSPRGFILDYNDFDLIKEFTNELKIYLKNNKGLFIKINPYIKYQERDKDGNIIGDNKDDLVNLLKSLGYIHYGFYVKSEEKKDLEPRWISVLDIDKPMDELLKNMKQTTRWMINKSEKNCIEIEEIGYDKLDEFKKIMNHTAERRSFDDRALSYYQIMYKELSKSNMIKILLGKIDLSKFKNNIKDDIKHLNDRIDSIKNNPKKQNQVNEFESQINALNKRLKDVENDINNYGNNPYIAAGLYLSYGSEVVYLFGGSYKEFMSYGAQYLMQYEMIKYAKDNNFKRFNFYGIDGDFSKESINYGLFDFKRGFNSNVVELIGEFDLVENKFNYKLYNFLLKQYKRLRRIKNKIKKGI